jgi:hypothetical protein
MLVRAAVAVVVIKKILNRLDYEKTYINHDSPLPGNIIAVRTGRTQK